MVYLTLYKHTCSLAFLIGLWFIGGQKEVVFEIKSLYVTYSNLTWSAFPFQLSLLYAMPPVMFSFLSI